MTSNVHLVRRSRGALAAAAVAALMLAGMMASGAPARAAVLTQAKQAQPK